MSGRLTRLAARAPHTKPICTPFVSQESTNAERCHSRFSSGVIAVAENHVVRDRTIATESIANTRQREASAPGCMAPKEEDEEGEEVDGVVGIACSVSPERNREDRGGARQAYLTRLIAHRSLDLTDRFVRPDLLDLNPPCDFFVNADRFDEFPFHGKKDRARTRQVFRHQGI